MSAGSEQAPPTRRRLFGTDGIRAPFGTYPLDRATVGRLGACLAERLGGQRRPPLVVLGGDTRASTPELCRWLAAGLAAGGARCRYAGTLPTPAVGWLARELEAAAGIAVSASHNLAPDNGIKLFDGRGFKWSPGAEAELELALVEAGAGGEGTSLPDLPVDAELAPRYPEALAATLPGDRPLDGLRIVVDCAHGAASPFAAALFERLGARVRLLHDRPNGHNINVGGGSSHPEVMARATAESGCDLGVALDGDADRAVFADAGGRVRDGDSVLYLWARALLRQGRLDPPQIVATSMSNLGLEVALAEQGIEVVRCGVGDRTVVRTMQREGILLGGEQSGHVVHLGLATTGDGLLTAIQIAAIVRREGGDLAALLAPLPRYPQILKNVVVSRRPDLMTLPGVATAARAIERRLGKRGRLVLRYSGTEPLARVMIEGPDQDEIEAMADELIEEIRTELGPAAAGEEGR